MGNCKAATTKGLRVLWAIRKSFQFSDEDVVRLLNSTFVGQYLEFGIRATSPCFKCETDMLERVRW